MPLLLSRHYYYIIGPLFPWYSESAPQDDSRLAEEQPTSVEGPPKELATPPLVERSRIHGAKVAASKC